jgi:hypothetical protein
MLIFLFPFTLSTDLSTQVYLSSTLSIELSPDDALSPKLFSRQRPLHRLLSAAPSPSNTITKILLYSYTTHKYTIILSYDKKVV